jgi:aryl-alcohol dehydrogenase-like predicted oxidoreductase
MIIGLERRLDSRKDKKMAKKVISRRGFIGSAAAAVPSLGALASSQLNAASLAGSMPKRTLGKTGLEVSILSFGGGSQFLKNKDGDWEPMLERAITLGINFFDNSSNYQWGAKMTSEERFGEILPKYRKEILICTKFDSREPAEAMRELETSLKRMKTDYLDVLMIHSIEPSEDLPALEKGVYKELLRLKEEGVARFIGFSSMNSAPRSKELIEKLDLDVAILAMNPTKYGNFAQVALPAARRNNVGTIAMKVIRDLLGNGTTPRELMEYAWTQEGVASAVIGHYGMDILEENVRLAKEFGASAKAAVNHRGLEDRLAHLAGPHALCWARPEYRDC